MAYTTIDDPSAHFQTMLYTGDASETALTNDGNSDLQPDLIWVKSRSNAGGYFDALQDTSRGIDKVLSGVANGAENDTSEQIKSVQSDGFTVGDNSDGGNYVNLDTYTYVAWQWKANGGSTTSGGGDDSIGTSAYQANDTAGFSIITYTGNNTDDATVKHGLSAEPDIIISKSRTSAHHWWVHGNAIPTGDTNYMLLQGDGAVDAAADVIKSIGSSTVTIGTNTNINTDASLYVQYAFRSIQGYSKFGSYTGNGSADGAFTYLGFKPRLVIIKNSGRASTDWIMCPGTIDKNNPVNDLFEANSTAAVNTAIVDVDFYSNGFKIRGAGNPTNTSADTYVYMAFAEQPFVTSSGVPATAR